VGRRVKIETALDPRILRALGDRGQCHQVIMNLCLNACDAMPMGGTLTIATSVVTPPEELLTARPRMRKGPHVCISVADTGVGMERATLDRIFEPFFSTKPERLGRGLGLSMVSGIVDRHGGAVEVESEPGKGSTFRVYFPATEESEKKEEVRAAGVLRGKETILVVDDDPAFRQVAGRFLAGLGYTVIEAPSGDRALALLREGTRKVDLVLLDMVMPNVGGAETFMTMKRDYPGTPVIICTGFSVDYQCQRALDEGAKDFIQKPFEPNVLAMKIRSVLDGV